MIVVVGIIAVLAAVIVPNIGRFIGSGEAGAKAAESESVQTAMNAMMADRAITAVTASAITATKEWVALPAGADACPLGANAVSGCPATGYLQAPDTIYFYCWDALGQIKKQFETSEATKTC
jgi:type II secretory pathway pseudopilin PulG